MTYRHEFGDYGTFLLRVQVSARATRYDRSLDHPLSLGADSSSFVFAFFAFEFAVVVHRYQSISQSFHLLEH